MRFYKSKNCWIYKAVVGFKSDGSVLYKEGRARTQEEALTKKKEAEKSNTSPNSDKELVSEHLDWWLNNIAKPTTRYSTWERYEVVVRKHLKPNIGGYPLKQLTITHVSNLWAKLAKREMSAGMIKKCSEVLATALESAVTHNKISFAPTANAARPTVEEHLIEVFTDDAAKAIIKASKSDRFEALYKLALGTGAREGELLCLEPDDFDLDAGTVKIVKTLNQTKDGFFVGPPKSKAGLRTISLPSFVLEVVKRHLEGREPGRPVFCTRDGNYVSRTNFIRKDWRRLLLRAKVPYRKFHTTRHTHASRLLAAGVDPAEVAKRIGDKIETLMRVYAHWIPTANRDTAAKVDHIYAEAPSKAQSFGERAES